MNKHYRKGYIFELKVRDYMRQQGYEVFRCAGSHSPADLICMKPAHSNPFVTLIQCKTKNQMTKKERQDFKNFCKKIGSIGCIASSVKGKVFLDLINN